MLKHTFPNTAHQPDEKFMVFVLIQEVNLWPLDPVLVLIHN